MFHHGFQAGGQGDRPGFFHRQAVQGLLPVIVLSSIKDKPAHGGEIAQSLKEKFSLETPRPVIYVLLRRLETAGLVISNWDVQESGPARRKYTITEGGLDMLNFGLERLKKASKIIALLIGEQS